MCRRLSGAVVAVAEREVELAMRCDGRLEGGIRAGGVNSWVVPYMMRAKLRFDMAFSGRAERDCI